MQPQNPVTPTILPDRSKTAKPARTSFRLTRRQKEQKGPAEPVDQLSTPAAVGPHTPPPPPPSAAPPAPAALGRFSPVASGPGAALAAVVHDHTSGLERLAVHAVETGLDASIRRAEEE